ncbi:GtrA family protein [Haloechinothrix halophila]|uniref:GtrA family protein n=1 Tax=Haloechinothrix halophila TaxID=1069073 RepID=UPI0005553DD3|nr:GtrA family protein [Haloechinothrix halophila]
MTKLALTARRKRRFLLWGRYTGASVIAAVISEAAILTAYGLGAAAMVAGVIAFVAGAIPNYLLNRYWAWQQRGRADRKRETLPYVVIVIVTAVTAIGVTTLADSWAQAHIASHSWRTILVGAVYLATYGFMFIVKFVLFDRLIFANRGARTPGPTSQA